MRLRQLRLRGEGGLYTRVRTLYPSTRSSNTLYPHHSHHTQGCKCKFIPVRGGRPKKRGMTNPPHRPIQNFAWRINRAVYRYPLTGNITGGLVCAERTQQRRNQTDQAPPRQCAPKHAAPFRVPLHRLKRVHMTPRGPCAHGSEQLKQSARNHVDTTSFRRVYLT